ncbi:VOC family protein [Lentzea nigeriaca]|uniref:VOC family protein n=1 Tax=Lentzea nigeriaca TaxID=1128665 RepID=UPI001957DF03|nr:VOC family protein [Lentzea nigeriaca]MBM7860900.1 catechol 2,3-dioxygenase-like lactoylglutathione lyase family enzyme [Lentzea nigeriaca]
MDTAESALPQATLPGAVAVDHLASTVSDLEAAVAFLTAELGGQECYREGPIADATGDWMARKLGVPAEASARIVMIRLGKRLNFEVFEYTCPGASRTAGQPGTPGSSCLLLAVADLPVFAARMRLAGLVVEGDERRLLRCRTEFGLTFEVVEDRAVAPRLPVDVVGMRYTVADLPAAQRFLTSVIGMGAVRGNVHRLGNGPLVELAPATLPGVPPGNHDVGGHHLAFAVTDVDRAAEFLAHQDGVHVMGTPETVTTGPIAGDRWVYFTSPFGMQMELICMPDGNLPYERATSARRWQPC